MVQDKAADRRLCFLVLASAPSFNLERTLVIGCKGRQIGNVCLAPTVSRPDPIPVV